MKLIFHSIIILTWLMCVLSIPLASEELKSIQLGILPVTVESDEQISSNSLKLIAERLESRFTNKPYIEIPINHEDLFIINEKLEDEYTYDRHKYPDSLIAKEYWRRKSFNHAIITELYILNSIVEVHSKVVSGITGKSIASSQGSYSINDEDDALLTINSIADSLSDIINRKLCTKPEFLDAVYSDTIYVGITRSILVQAQDNYGREISFNVLDFAGLDSIIEYSNSIIINVKAPESIIDKHLNVSIVASNGCDSAKENISLYVSRYRLPTSKYSIGLISTVGPSYILGDSKRGNAILSYGVGGFLHYRNPGITAIFEARYSHRGTNGDVHYQNVVESTGKTFEYSLDYIDLNVLAKGKPLTFLPKLLLGISYSIPIGSSFTIDNESIGQSTIYKFNHKSEWAGLAGIGLEANGFGSGRALITFEIRARWGFTKIGDNSPVDGAIFYNGKNLSFEAMIGFGL